MKNFDQSILVIGAGKMGGAIIKSWLIAGIQPNLISIIDPFLRKEDVEYYQSKGAYTYKKIAEIPANKEFNIIMLAIKPQSFDEVLGDYNKFITPDNVILSIAAGKNLTSIKKIFGQASQIIRSMPNLPALIKEGITGIIASDNTSAQNLANVKRLLNCCGDTLIVKDEQLIDAITAISGSGPAYIFHFAEAIYEAAKNLGFNDDEATFLTKKTILGSAKLMDASELSFANLRKNVTSKAGTTEAALKVLMGNDALKKLMNEAVNLAFERSKELSK